MLRLCQLLILGLMGTGLSGDEVLLKDGRRIDGTVLSAPEADTVDVQVGEGRMSAVMHYARSQVERITRGPNERQQKIASLRGQADTARHAGDTTGLWKLAISARDLDASDLLRDLAQAVCDLDRHHPEAHRALGLSLFRGIWMRPHEIAIANGRIRHEGLYLTWDQYQQALADEEARKARMAAFREEEEQRRKAREAQRRIQEADTQLGMPSLDSHSCNDSLLRRMYWASLARPPVVYVPVPSGPSGGVWASGQSSHCNWGFNWTW